MRMFGSKCAILRTGADFRQSHAQSGVSIAEAVALRNFKVNRFRKLFHGLRRPAYFQSDSDCTRVGAEPDDAGVNSLARAASVRGRATTEACRRVRARSRR